MILGMVIFKVGKVRFGLFSHNYRYYSVITKFCPDKLLHVASFFVCEINPFLKYERSGINVGLSNPFELIFKTKWFML